MRPFKSLEQQIQILREPLDEVEDVARGAGQHAADADGGGKAWLFEEES